MNILFVLVFVLCAWGIAVTDFYKTVKAGKNAPYTIMVYMNGSDLESEFGAATDDLTEMLDSGLDSRNANVIILTGGTMRWQNNAIPETECVIWQLTDGYLYELQNMGKVNMGNPDTLRDFLKFGINNFPAQKYGLIMWDHGGGSIAGFGHDEKFNDASLSLLDMKKAFEEADLDETQLEFLGFDACLMATVEMAILASDYAKVLIAAEDLEPGEGWNYHFLSALNENAEIDGFELGEIIVDTFMEFYEAHGLADEEILTLSVIDTQKASRVMDAMGWLMSRSSVDFNDAEISYPAFRNVAVRRANTKTFGEGSPRDNYADMVDIGDMAIQLADKFPFQSEAVLRALENCVTYNRHNSDVEIYGLSTFYIYGGKSEGIPSLRTYSALEMNTAYTQFLHRFFDKLVRSANDNESICDELVLWQPLEDGTFRMAGLQSPTLSENIWPTINGEYVSLFPISCTENARRYAIPIEVNNHDADLIILLNENHLDGKILGIRHNAHNVFQKGYDPVNETDEIFFYNLIFDFGTHSESWEKNSFAVTAPLLLSWQDAPASFKQGERCTDFCNTITYSQSPKTR
jgi:hypothetical protein